MRECWSCGHERSAHQSETTWPGCCRCTGFTKVEPSLGNYPLSPQAQAVLDRMIEANREFKQRLKARKKGLDSGRPVR